MEAKTDIRKRALRLLARREYTRAELERKLAPIAEGDGRLAQVLDELAGQGWLSDRRAAEQTVHQRRAKFGGRRIERELKDKGVAQELIADALRDVKATELASGREVWRKKFGRLPKSAAERGKQMRFLQGRGFSMEVIYAILRKDEE